MHRYTYLLLCSILLMHTQCNPQAPKTVSPTSKPSSITPTTDTSLKPSPTSLSSDSSELDTIVTTTQAGAALKDLLKTIIEGGNDKTPQEIASTLNQAVCSEEGDEEAIILAFIAQAPTYGINLYAQDAAGDTPMHAAASHNKAGIIDALRLAGVEPDQALDGKGATPLHTAAKFGQEEAARKLVALGASVNAQDHEREEKRGGESMPVGKNAALHYAAYHNRTGLLEFLLKEGANTQLGNVIGQTPLHVAVNAGSEAFVELLAKSQGDVDAKDEFGNTPSHYAAFHNHGDMLEKLHKAGADVNATNGGGDTPLHIAAQKGDAVAAIEKLLVLGADRRMANTEGQLPIQIARELGHTEAQRALEKRVSRHRRGGRWRLWQRG